jgi:hypothetical protein
MKQQKLWIFGDSYAASTYHPDSSIGEITWVKELEKNYDVSNFALSGSGPDYSLNNLINEIAKYKKYELRDIIVIFIIPEIYRINFDFLKPHDQIVSIAMHNLSLNQNGKDLIKPYLKYETFIKDVFKHYVLSSSYMDTELTKMLGWLQLHSHMFKKMLIWPTNDKASEWINLSSPNVLFIDTPIFEIEDDHADFGYDSRYNHLTQVNHYTMLDQISSWIDHNTPIDIGKFTIIKKQKT